jgi:glycosyltransferase involved in cell wall biosynthesis
MRLLILSAHPSASGPIPAIVATLAGALADLGCEVTSEPWGSRRDDESAKTKATRVVSDIVHVRRLLQRGRFDAMILHTSQEWKSMVRDLPLLLATRRSRCRIIVEFHGGHAGRLAEPGHRGFKAVSWLVFKLADGALFLSSEEARDARQFDPRGRFRVVSNPFVRSAAEPSANGRGSDHHDPVLLFVGRLIPEKGVLDVLDAMALLRGRAPCRLVIAGAGPAASMAAERIQSLGLDEHVTLAGRLDRSELAAAYRASDLLVFPTYWGEGFPTVIAEAMDAGLPIVTTATRGNADHLRDGVNALFVPARAPVAIADAVERLLRNDELRAAMGQANRVKVQEFAPATVGRDYLATIEDLTRGQQGDQRNG